MKLFTVFIVLALSGASVLKAGDKKDVKNLELQKIETDKAAIKSMIGCYKVTFDFAETFAPDTAYHYHARKSESGIEYVFLLAETERSVSLQHLLIVDDSMIVKHWRQDWIYENTELLSFYRDNEWKKITLDKQTASGTWTQKVYQVDDGPRYESYGTWIHADGRHFWESVCDAPLPRREYTQRSDYNVMKRHGHIEITAYGWMLEQDNEKTIRDSAGKDKLLCWEKGFERFYKGNYNCSVAINWWEKNKEYWADVRKIWEEMYNRKTDKLKIIARIDDKVLYERLFRLGREYSKTEQYNSKEASKKIRATIEMYLTENSKQEN